jgi:hypothetical protein
MITIKKFNKVNLDFNMGLDYLFLIYKIVLIFYLKLSTIYVNLKLTESSNCVSLLTMYILYNLNYIIYDYQCFMK